MTERIRLLWLIDSFNVGGAESLVLPFVTNYDRSKYELFVACLTTIGGNPIEAQLRRQGIEITNLGARNLRDVAAFRRLLRLIRERRINLVHAHLTYSSTWAAIASRFTGVPSVATLHVAPPARGAAAIRDRIMRFVLERWARKVFMVSGALRDDYLSRGGLSESRIEVVHNGIDVGRFRIDPAAARAQIARELAITAGGPVIATISVLRPGKGIEVLLRAIPAVVQKIRDTTFVIIGDGPMREEWEALSSQLGVAPYVRWAGHRSDVYALLAGCDLLVHPSLADAFPTVLLEAMAAGVPVIASKVGGIPEIVEPGESGLLVPPGDAPALSNAIVDLLIDRSRMSAMGRRAQQIANDRFSTAAWLARLDGLYSKRRPKIAFIEFAGKGGMIHYAFQLCRGLTAVGADVTLVTTREYELSNLDHPFRVETLIELWDPKPSGRQSTAIPAVVWRKVRRVFRAARYYGEWLRVIRYVARTQPDVVILGDVRFPFDLFPLRLLRRKAKILADICHNVHPYAAGGKAGGLFDRSRWKHHFYQRIYKLFDLVFVHYERNRKEFSESFGIANDRIGVIVHGNEEIFRDLRNPSVDAAAIRQRLGIGKGEPIVLFFGTLSRYKGTDVLLRAFPAIHDQTGARLVVAGFPFHDFNMDEHRKLARDLGIERAVVWVPEYIASEEIAAWMELASVIVFPYRDIYQSGALHVPQTFGVPIVASRVGAMQDVVEDGVSGLLVEPENPEALAAAVTRLLRDRDLAEKLGGRAAADAQGPFSWNHIARLILEKEPLHAR